MSQSRIDAVLFDMDGVVTDTAEAHAVAWKRLFDDYLERRANAGGEAFRPFDARADYRAYVDGKPRYDGVATFLASRGIELSFGRDDDDPGEETICGLGNRKNRYFNAWLEESRVRTFPASIALIEELRAAGIRTATFTSSRNADAVLKSAGIGDLFEVKVDGVVMAQKALPGKPEPAIMHEAASALGVPPERAAVIEDAQAGVEAGRRGGFALVVGVDRGGHGEALKEHGAHLVVGDLGELVLDENGRLIVNTLDRVPLVWDHDDDLRGELRGKRPVIFLDYDGTLTPIVDDPDAAILSDRMRATIKDLARHHTVAIVSGRDVATMRRLVRLDNLFYAGSHGFEISGPEGWHDTVEQGVDALPELDRAEAELREALEAIAGSAVERKRFSIAVHYRRAAASDVTRIEQVVDDIAARHRELRKGYGKKVFRLLPDIEWDKGHAVMWLLGQLGLEQKDVLPLYIGDDLTDEDAFRVLRGRGLGIVVRGEDMARPTAARYALFDPDDVRRFLAWLIELDAGGTR